MILTLYIADSVDFVMVILLSDITDMVGGELQVYTRNMSGPEAAAELNKKGMDPEHIRTVSYDVDVVTILQKAVIVT